MMKIIGLAGLLLATSALFDTASAQDTVECHSRQYQYDECWAGPIKSPQLIHQISSSPCILNRTWGYNPRSRYVWVAQGCAGVFADVSGYHHGRGDTFDSGARRYDHRGHDVGEVVAGAVVGALIDGFAQEPRSRHTTSNYRADDGYNGCHGVGCQVDNPDEEIDTRPQFDNNGEPNFDTEGNYQGCHGVGCLTDDPND